MSRAPDRRVDELTAEVRRVLVAAIEVAIAPPLEPRNYTTQVQTRRIAELRAALQELGVDWRVVKAAQAERDREARAARAERA